MEFTVRVFKDWRKFEHQAEKGANLLEVLKLNDHEINSFCNGQGICGKCKVRLEAKSQNLPKAEEIKLLGTKAIYDGIRLACMNSVESDIDVHLNTAVSHAKIVTWGKQKKVKLSPQISKRHLILAKPSLNDQRSDTQRVKDELSFVSNTIPLPIARQLPNILRTNGFGITVITNGTAIIGAEPGDTTNCFYGIAADIGTTTIAAYLLDLNTGKHLSACSFLNPQKMYGADVISRIKHTMDKTTGLNDMQSAIVSAINQGITTLTDAAGIDRSDIYKIVFTGNTAMMHFLLAISAKNLALAPFIPATNDKIEVYASELGININENAIAMVIPTVSAYVGADTLCAIEASGMDNSKAVSLLIDFGTNGEIVLGNSEWLLACSTAAGPAFEAANIRCGIGGVSGALDSFAMDETIEFTTIDEQKAVGICGTGLIDIVSELLRVGIIDETGRFISKDELSEQNEFIVNRLTTIDGQPAFVIVNAHETKCNEDIVITQKDIRELQNAKAAIAAGIEVLILRTGINANDISKVYLAGGFGSLINPQSALNIGLLPSQLKGRIESIGNAAGMGAQMILLSHKTLLKTEKIKKKLKYIELSSDKSFGDFFVNSMLFP